MTRTAPLTERINRSRGETTHTGMLLSIHWAGTSSVGNPTFRVTFEGHGEGADYCRGLIALTQVNGSVGYEIDNFRSGQRVTVGLTRAGRIFAIEAAFAKTSAPLNARLTTERHLSYLRDIIGRLSVDAKSVYGIVSTSENRPETLALDSAMKSTLSIARAAAAELQRELDGAN